MKATILKNVKKGEVFKFRPSETAKVYVRDDYDRESKKYEYYNYFNIGDWNLRKGTCIVYVDFEF
jgi:hypothetical protein